jgi:hypothetical protein
MGKRFQKREVRLRRQHRRRRRRSVELFCGSSSAGQSTLIGAVVTGTSISWGAAVDGSSIRKGNATSINQMGTIFCAIAINNDRVSDLEIAFLPSATA